MLLQVTTRHLVFTYNQNVCYQNVLLPKHPITKMSSYRNVQLPKCPVTKMSGFRNVLLPKCPVTKMYVTKTSITKVSFTEMSGYRKNMLILGNSHACILVEPEVAFLKKFDDYVSDMIAVTVYTVKHFIRYSSL